MSEERRTPDPGAADDPRVSDIYRDVAAERTPEHLDQAVLREAAAAARPRYWRLRLWTRPAAWAAIVLLSATLLLQVSQVQPPLGDTTPPVLELDDRSAPGESAERATRMERERGDAGRAAKATGTTVPRQEQPAIEALEEAVSRDADMLMQAVDIAPAAPAAASGGTPTPACDATARAAPEHWLECIAELEDAGLAVAAEQERRLLAEAFPDFEAP